jgi:hypothetical protein
MIVYGRWRCGNVTGVESADFPLTLPLAIIGAQILRLVRRRVGRIPDVLMLEIPFGTATRPADGKKTFAA